MFRNIFKLLFSSFRRLAYFGQFSFILVNLVLRLPNLWCFPLFFEIGIDGLLRKFVLLFLLYKLGCFLVMVVLVNFWQLFHIIVLNSNLFILMLKTFNKTLLSVDNRGYAFGRLSFATSERFVDDWRLFWSVNWQFWTDRGLDARSRWWNLAFLIVIRDRSFLDRLFYNWTHNFYRLEYSPNINNHYCAIFKRRSRTIFFKKENIAIFQEDKSFYPFEPR